VRRSQRWWSKGARRAVPWAFGAGLGIAAEHSLYGWDHLGSSIPDLLTGWCLIGSGLLAARLQAGALTGAWLAVAGVAWFVPNFANIGWSGLSWAGVHTLYFHRGPLLAAVVTYPRGRPTGRVEALAVGGLVAASLVAPIWRSDPAASALSVAAIVFAAYLYLIAVGRERRMRLRALRLTALVAGAIAVTALVRIARSAGPTATATLHAYQAALCAAAVAALVGLVRRPWDQIDVTDLVVQLGASRSGVVRDALARALGDPSLVVGYRLAGATEYVDAAGRPIHIPEAGSGRATTFVEQAGERVAVLVHDPGVLDDPALVGGVATAAGLAAANVRLRAAVQAQVAELQDSRRRLVAAADQERERLGQRLHDGAQQRLAELETVLRSARRDSPSEDTVAQVARSEVQLERVREDLLRLAVGLHPLQLSEKGLGHALAALAAEFPVPVELTLEADQLSTATSVCAYFVCSEALANVAKYAAASHVVIALTATTDDRVAITVEDDGVGGADPARGSGLRGLTDRVEALGGTLVVDSPPGRGTRLTATIPVDRARP
jgi:signal transduction histidine kinase